MIEVFAGYIVALVALVGWALEYRHRRRETGSLRARISKLLAERVHLQSENQYMTAELEALSGGPSVEDLAERIAKAELLLQLAEIEAATAAVLGRE